jgi:serralysin
MNGTSRIGGGSLGNPGPSWHVMGSGDYNRDGRPDILWQNASGEVGVWDISGISVVGAAILAGPRPSRHA